MKQPSMILLSALIAVTACTKTETEVRYVPEASPKASPMVMNGSRTDVEALRSLLNSKAPNLALAELLSKSVAREHRQEIKALFADLSVEETKAIILKVQEDNKSIRSNYLFHGQVYKDNRDLLKNSLVNTSFLTNEPYSIEGQPFSIENQLKVSAFSYLKNKALDEIISTYDKRAQELADELANDIAIEIGENHPDLARQIESGVKSSSQEEVIKMIQKAKPIVEKIDTYFRASNLNENEQYVVTISGIIAGTVYMQVKDKESFKRILAEGKRIAKDIESFKKKAKEFSFLVNTLETHIENTGKNIKDLGAGMTGAKRDLENLFSAAKEGMNGSSNVHSRRIIDFLHKKVISGKEVKPDGTNPSIFSKQVSFIENFNKSINAAANLTANLGAIVETSMKMSQLLGIKPSKDLMKVLDKAQKVSAVISTVQAGIAGFASGGFIGAMGAISSGPLMSMMGGGGSRDSAKLDEISKKLDVVIKQQQMIMKMQVETMNMIKELALMVDMYHQREMAALAELRDYSLVELEMEKASLNKEIRSCERMINYQLASIWNSYNFGRESFNSINNIDLIRDRFTTSITGLNDIRRIMYSVEENGYSACQTGIAEAFGGNDAKENPLRAIFATEEYKNLYAFQRDTYMPLVNTLEHFADTDSFDNIPLHLPVSNFDSLKHKAPYIEYAKSTANSNEVYDLENLISVKNLERYLGHLLILNPLLDIDKSVWQKSYQDIITSYIENSNTENNQNTRSHYFLNNALKLVQSSIAQEALLAGEPLLFDLHDRYFEDIFSASDCLAIKRTDIPSSDYPFFCAVRSNRLLMKNLVHFHLRTGMNDNIFSQYEEAFKKGDAAAIARILDMSTAKDRIVVTKSGDENSISINVSNPVKDPENKNNFIAIKLPTPAELKDGKIIYSENMPRLLKMQDLILDAIEKVAPVKRGHKDNELLKLLMVGV